MLVTIYNVVCFNNNYCNILNCFIIAIVRKELRKLSSIQPLIALLGPEGKSIALLTRDGTCTVSCRV